MTPAPNRCRRHDERYGNGRCKPCSRAARTRYRRTRNGQAVTARYNNTCGRQIGNALHRLQYVIGKKEARVTELERMLTTLG